MDKIINVSDTLLNDIGTIKVLCRRTSVKNAMDILMEQAVALNRLTDRSLIRKLNLILASKGIPPIILDTNIAPPPPIAWVKGDHTQNAAKFLDRYYDGGHALKMKGRSKFLRFDGVNWVDVNIPSEVTKALISLSPQSYHIDKTVAGIRYFLKQIHRNR